MESHAPFGGLIRVKVMETSMALHSDDAKNIVMKKESKK
jgi:Fe2+ transport system protein FeoA